MSAFSSCAALPCSAAVAATRARAATRQARKAPLIPPGAVLLLLVPLLSGLGLLCAAQEGNQPSSNPYTNLDLKRPPFRPFPSPRPTNVFEIPELPIRFEVSFQWNNRLGGHWIYDYEMRRAMVTYFTEGGGQIKYYWNYQVLEEKMIRWTDERTTEGSTCSTFDLAVPYHRMWSPQSWRHIEVDDIYTTEASFFEAERELGSVHESGFWNHRRMTFQAYTNGTVRELTIERDRWLFFNFTDMSVWDNYDVAHSQALLSVRPPEMECIYAGPLTAEYASVYQQHTPWSLIKPGTDDSAARQAFFSNYKNTLDATKAGLMQAVNQNRGGGGRFEEVGLANGAAGGAAGGAADGRRRPPPPRTAERPSTGPLRSQVFGRGERLR